MSGSAHCQADRIGGVTYDCWNGRLIEQNAQLLCSDRAKCTTNAFQVPLHFAVNSQIPQHQTYKSVIQNTFE